MHTKCERPITQSEFLLKTDNSKKAINRQRIYKKKMSIKTQ